MLDKLNIQYMLANRVAMGRGLNPRRFLWVPFDDALMLPLDNTSVADNPDRKFFYQRESGLLKKYMSEAGVTALPGTLDQYVTKVTTPTLERQRRVGAVAVKFEAAYLRSLDFGESRTDDAARVYARYAKGGVPSKRKIWKCKTLFSARLLVKPEGSACLCTFTRGRDAGATLI